MAVRVLSTPEEPPRASEPRSGSDHDRRVRVVKRERATRRCKESTFERLRPTPRAASGCHGGRGSGSAAITLTDRAGWSGIQSGGWRLVELLTPRAAHVDRGWKASRDVGHDRGWRCCGRDDGGAPIAAEGLPPVGGLLCRPSARNTASLELAAQRARIRWTQFPSLLAAREHDVLQIRRQRLTKCLGGSPSNA